MDCRRYASSAVTRTTPPAILRSFPYSPFHVGPSLVSDESSAAWHAMHPYALYSRRPSSVLGGASVAAALARGVRSTLMSPNPSVRGENFGRSYGVKYAVSWNFRPPPVASDQPTRICITGLIPGTPTNTAWPSFE